MAVEVFLLVDDALGGGTTARALGFSVSTDSMPLEVWFD
jgi:hypothetical protein